MQAEGAGPSTVLSNLPKDLVDHQTSVLRFTQATTKNDTGWYSKKKNSTGKIASPPIQSGGARSATSSSALATTKTVSSSFITSKELLNVEYNQSMVSGESIP